MTRILFMHQTSAVGGGSYCLLNIIRELDMSLFDPVVALKNEGPLVSELRKLDVEVVFFPEMAAIPYNRGLLLWGSILAYWRVEQSKMKLKQLLSEKKIDVVYLNNMMLCRYLQPAKEIGCKTVVHVREHWPMNEHKQQLEWARKCVYKYADKMVAINHYSASMFPEKEAIIVYDWIDMDSRYTPMPLREIFDEDMTGKKVLLYTGGMQRIKGAYEVVKSFVEEIKDKDCRLLMMGISKELSGKGIVGIVKMMMCKFGIPTYEYKVKMLIRQDRRIAFMPSIYEIKDIIEQANCLVSFFTIPHANLAIAESIILGTPVIAARTEEAEEYSLDGKLAFLYEMNNFRAYIDTLKMCINVVGSDYKVSLDDREKIRILFSKERNSIVLNTALKDFLG